MARALALAEQGLFTTTPNPRVGCVIVKDGVIVGEGAHLKAGEPHAEVHALRAAGDKARGATAYVTLEPCAHQGRTPPCADALIAAGVARVVAAMTDPNPLVAGKGLARIAAAGIATASGLLEEQAQELNIGFISRMTRGRPWLRLKVAASLDGKTALNNGVSQWITGPEARSDGHRFRARSCAMLTGIGTVLADNPQLTVRAVETTRQPLRIVLDSQLQLPVSAAILQGGATLVVCAETGAANQAKVAMLAAMGVEVLPLPNGNGRVDLSALLLELGRRGINELMVEAGPTLNGAMMQSACVDELLLYQAPVLLGNNAQGMFDWPALTSLETSSRLRVKESGLFGDDIRLILRRI